MNNLTPIEYQNKRVLTTQQLAQAYETETNNIIKNFSRNVERFAIEKDYFILQGDKLKEFKNCMTNSHLVDKHTPILYLWTDRGANRHSKILDTDKAWQQFDLLEETYFKVKNGQAALPQMSQLEIIAQVAKAAADQEKQVKQIVQKLDKHSEELETVNHRINNLDCVNIQGNLKQKLNAMIGKYAFSNGIIYSKAWKEFRKAFNVAYSTNIMLLVHNYKNNNELKSLTVPEFLEKSNKLYDAIRVADKMINELDKPQQSYV